MIRGAFMRAVRKLDDGGTPLSTVILNQLKKSPLETLRVISGFIPKEMMIEATVHQELDALSDAALDSEIARLAAQTGALPGIAGEVEPADGRLVADIPAVPEAEAVP